MMHHNTLQLQRLDLLQHTITHCNSIMDGERDPRNLRLCFTIIPALARRHLSSTAEVTDTITATHNDCNTQSLQHTITATHGDCNTLKHTATRRLQHTITATHGDCNILKHTATRRLQHTITATHGDCNTLKHTATHTSVLQYCVPPFLSTAEVSTTLQRTVTYCNAWHCNTLPSTNTATHYNVLQNTAINIDC